jgi:hypothetical protein
MRKLIFNSEEYEFVYNFIYSKLSLNSQNLIFNIDSDFEYSVFEGFTARNENNQFIKGWEMFDIKNTYITGYSGLGYDNLKENRFIYQFSAENPLVLPKEDEILKVYPKGSLKAEFNGNIEYPEFDKLDMYTNWDLFFVFDLKFEFCIIEYLRENYTICYYKKNKRKNIELLNNIQSELNANIICKKDVLGLEFIHSLPPN